MTEELLTANEIDIVTSLGHLANRFALLVSDGNSHDEDIRESVSHFHALQNMVLSQAAARRYPDKFRLMGKAFPVGER